MGEASGVGVPTGAGVALTGAVGLALGELGVVGVFVAGPQATIERVAARPRPVESRRCLVIKCENSFQGKRQCVLKIQLSPSKNFDLKK